MLQRYFDKYSSSPRCEALLNTIVSEYRKAHPQEDRVNDKVKDADYENYNKKALYEFFFSMRETIPAYLDKDIYGYVIEYIGNTDFADFPRQRSKAFSPTQKQLNYEDTKWWIYFFDETIDGIIGVSRAIMHLESFCKAKIVIQKISSAEKRTYIGHYFLEHGDEFLRLKLRLKKGNLRDLQILVHVGSDDDIELALGISRNIVDPFFWTETVLITPAKKSAKNIPEFFPRNLRSSKVPDYVWDLFENKMTSYIEFPKDILTAAKLKSWIAENKKEINKSDKG